MTEEEFSTLFTLLLWSLNVFYVVKHFGFHNKSPADCFIWTSGLPVALKWQKDQYICGKNERMFILTMQKWQHERGNQPRVKNTSIQFYSPFSEVWLNLCAADLKNIFNEHIYWTYLINIGFQSLHRLPLHHQSLRQINHNCIY